MSKVQHGRCLCGAVTVEAVLSDEMGACFCDKCVRWSGSAMIGVDAEVGSVVVSGPVKTYRSSSFAERAWCDTCGSNLWIRDDGKQYELMPGLFPNAGGARLTHVVYADRAPDGWNYAGDLKRVSAQDYETSNPFVPEGETS